MRKKSTTLTSGERSVLILVARGLTNKEISERLGMTISKVKMLLYGACDKMKARNRIEAVFIAIRQKSMSVNQVFSLFQEAHPFLILPQSEQPVIEPV